MNRDLARRILWTAAAVAALTGLLLTARAAFQLAARARVLDGYVELSGQLRELSRQSAHNLAAVQTFEGLPNPHPVPIADLLKSTLEGEKYDTREQPAEPTIEGWTVRRVEVSGPLPMAKVAELIEKVESQRPPWRLTACTLRATGEAGIAQVKLLLEALDKTP